MRIPVVAKDGTQLMPTNVKKTRRLLRESRARIYSHDPFTIQLNYETEKHTQPVELAMDTGYQTIGISVKGEKHEYVSEERTLLKDEKQNHDDQRKLRRARRGRKKYRKPRFDNRKKDKGWFAPSIENKKDRHVDLVKSFCKVFPVTDIILEMGQFDTAALEAVERGGPLPQGTDYQHGPKYGYDTLREAVFARDGHRCLVCGKRDVPLRLHHVGFRTGDRSNRMSNLATVCEACHIPKNHKPGGALWEMKVSRGTASAAFMNAVRWQVHEEVKALGPEVHITYGAVTKRARTDLNIEKSHANDTYCMGEFRPKHRCRTRHFEKRRRNNRVLEKFYDAKYVDVRDGKVKKAAELGTNRTNRSVPRDNPQNERSFRGEKKSKGERRIRRQRHPVQAGDIVYAKGIKVTCRGTMSGGKSVLLMSAKESMTGKAVTASPKKVTVIRHAGGWAAVSQG